MYGCRFFDLHQHTHFTRILRQELERGEDGSDIDGALLLERDPFLDDAR